jgi:hypothetical protein
MTMAIPPGALSQFAQPSDLTPEAALFERATTNANASLPEPERTDYKDGLDDDGWGYRYFDDGKVKIIVAPEGHRAGQILTGGPAFEAIMSRKPVLVPPPAPEPGAMPAPVFPTAGAGGMQGALDAWRAGQGGAPLPAPVFPAPVGR